MKKFFSALLVLVMVLALLPASALAAETNVWDAIEPAPTAPQKTNVYPAYGETLTTSGNVETSKGSDANAGTETKVADNCDFCLHSKNLAAGELPGCVAHCRFHALSFGDLNDPNSFVSKLLKAKDTVRIRPWLGTEPTLRYIPVVKTGVR